MKCLGKTQKLKEGYDLAQNAVSNTIRLWKDLCPNLEAEYQN